MRKKVALAPIRRASPADSPPLVAVSKGARGYPDARTLAEAIREAALRAVRIAAIPTAGLLGGCGAGSGDVIDGLTRLPLGWQGRIGVVVEGLRAPEEPVAPAGAVVPVQVEPIPPPPPVEPDPIPTGGVARPVEPIPSAPPPRIQPPPPEPDPVQVVGDMAAVKTTARGVRVAHAGVVPATLSDEALATALASLG